MYHLHRQLQQKQNTCHPIRPAMQSILSESEL